MEYKRGIIKGGGEDVIEIEDRFIERVDVAERTIFLTSDCVIIRDDMGELVLLKLKKES